MSRGQRETQRKTLLAIALVLLGAMLACGTGNQAPLNTATPEATSSPESPSGVIKGLALSPQGFPADYSKTIEFLEEAGSFPNAGVFWNGAWREDIPGGSDAGSIPNSAVSIVQSAAQYDYTPIITFGWRSGDSLHLNVPDNPTNDWTNLEARRLFAAMLEEFARDYQPPFLFLGNESQAYYIQDQQDYTNWIEFYNQAYEVVKAASPNTMVGPIFNYEQLAGVAQLNNWTEPSWGALLAHDFAKVDIVGITLYPFLSYATVEELPADYLDPLFERIGDTAVAVTETGWPAENLSGLDLPWESSEAAQVGYLSRLQEMLAGRDLRLINWLFLYAPTQEGLDPQTWQVFGSLSLRRPNGEPRAVYAAWQSFSP